MFLSIRNKINKKKSSLNLLFVWIYFSLILKKIQNYNLLVIIFNKKYNLNFYLVYHFIKKYKNKFCFN